ncbi:hypothetical protein GCM10027030_27340 [Luteococcus sediminum]
MSTDQPVAGWVDVTTPPVSMSGLAPSVAELRRAWDAVSQGRYARPDPIQPSPVTLAVAGPGPDGEEASVSAWRPAEPLVVVVGAHAQAGASTVALAVAQADPCARLLEISLPACSGLAGAGSAELGELSSWVRSQRDGVVIERPATVEAGDPLPLDRVVRRTVLDAGVQPCASGPGWVAATVAAAEVVVVVAAGTVPGIRRLEVAVDELGSQRCVTVVRAVSGGRLPRQVHAAMGPVLQRLVDEHRWAVMPCDGRLLVTGLSPAPLSKSVVSAGHTVLGLLSECEKGTK